jgi:glycogen debranching enzyme
MKVIHEWNGQKSENEAHGDFLLTAKNGSWLSLGNPNSSAYQGWVVLQGHEPYKLIDNIHLDGEVTSINNHVSHVERCRENSIEEYHLTQNVILLKITGYSGKARLDLDCRHVHDYRDQGRKYEIENNGEIVLVHYTKFSDGSMQQKEHENWIAIKGIAEVRMLGNWTSRDYEYDASRGNPRTHYVYEAFEWILNKDSDVIFAYGKDKDEANKRVKDAARQANSTRERHMKYCEKTLTLPTIEQNIALRALDRLTIKHPSREDETPAIIAGIPWFTQVWTRDELISLGGYILTERYYLTKEILQRYTANLKDGILPNRDPPSALASADGTGWLCMRWHQYMKKLFTEKKLKDFMTNEELKALSSQLDIIAKKIMERACEGLIENGSLETWVDTSDPSGQDNRAGARIEIQALALASLACTRYVHKLLKNNTKELDAFIAEYSKRVRDSFYREGKIWDGLTDEIQRPNVFIAHYVYPTLFTREEWKTAFKNTLNELWLEWGGLSSISKNDPLFCNEHTGLDNRSYHRGDSWIWINNIAALALKRTDARAFSKYIKAIKNASVEEMFYHGFLGHCAEISDAKSLNSKGCWAQAWSAGTLVELLAEIGMK